MEIEFDPRKNARNIATRGLSFELAHEFEITQAIAGLIAVFLIRRNDG
jgi:uncharacterized DUF497 family protein